MDSELEIIKICDGLYLSNDEAAENDEFLKSKGITHIVSIGGRTVNDKKVA
jgi:hypothetical protein